jgi:hypothetical protein
MSTENVNTIYWGMVEYVGPFTAARSGDNMRRISQLPMWSESQKVSPHVETANDDIAAGNVKRFSTVEELLNSLHDE